MLLKYCFSLTVDVVFCHKSFSLFFERIQKYFEDLKKYTAILENVLKMTDFLNVNV